MRIKTNEDSVAILVEGPDGERWATFRVLGDDVPDGLYPVEDFEDREGWRDVPATGGTALDVNIRERAPVRAHFAGLFFGRASR